MNRGHTFNWVETPVAKPADVITGHFPVLDTNATQIKKEELKRAYEEKNLRSFIDFIAYLFYVHRVNQDVVNNALLNIIDIEFFSKNWDNRERMKTFFKIVARPKQTLINIWLSPVPATTTELLAYLNAYFSETEDISPKP